MDRKAVSGMTLTLLLIGMLTLAFNIQPAKSEPRTWTVDDDGPADFHTTQEAINAANPPDTNHASIKRWSMRAIRSDLEDGLGTRLMDVFRLPFGASGGWGSEKGAEPPSSAKFRARVRVSYMFGS